MILADATFSNLKLRVRIKEATIKTNASEVEKKITAAVKGSMEKFIMKL
jgi:hypothetical protein